MKRSTFAVLFLLVCLVIGLAAVWVAWRFLNGNPHRKLYDTGNVIQQVQTLSQLVTVKYVMEKVVVLEDVKYSEWLGTSRLIMIAHGTIKAGVDFTQLKPGDITITGKKITIVLPPPRITDAYLDEKQTQIVERTTGVLRTFDKDMEQNARQQALSDLQRAARRNGILNDASERAQAQLANLFHQLGYETVEFRDSQPFLKATE